MHLLAMELFFLKLGHYIYRTIQVVVYMCVCLQEIFFVS